MTDVEESPREDEQSQRAEADRPGREREEHDAGIRIRGEAPATGHFEHGGVMPAVPPSAIDTPPPGSLQGSPLGIKDVVSGGSDRPDEGD